MEQVLVGQSGWRNTCMQATRTVKRESGLASAYSQGRAGIWCSKELKKEGYCS